MSDEVDKFLEHYGVPGMKWGVRRATNAQKGADRSRAAYEKRPNKITKSIADADQKHADKLWKKQDKKWEKRVYSTKGAIALHNKTADHMNNTELPKLNNNPKYKGKNLWEDPELEASYLRDYEKAVDRAYNRAIPQVHGTSPSGRKKAVYVFDGETESIQIKNVPGASVVKHADDPNETLVFLMKRSDATGHVTELNKAAEEVEHSDDVDAFLEHYGVPGMKWGVRRATSARKEAARTSNIADRYPNRVTKAVARRDQKRADKLTARSDKKVADVQAKREAKLTSQRAVKVKNTDRAQRLTAEGGKNRVASDDAVQARISKQIARKSGTNALSNQELRDLVTRMNLDQQYRSLAAQERKAKDQRQKELDDEISKWVDLASAKA